MLIRENAYAKLNISLDVFKARNDGYHDMRMIMQTVSLCDKVCITFDSSNSIHCSSNYSFIPNDEHNLAVKAAKSFYEASGISCDGISIEMNKSIPVGAGMAGGSADAAAVLRALNNYYGLFFSEQELLKVAEKVGSDVPYCVVGGTYLAEGRGEILTEISPLPDCNIIICKPDFSVSTPELFAALDKAKPKVRPDTNGIISSLKAGNLVDTARRMYNVFEDVDDRRMTVIKEIKKEMISAGALGAIMTGTGSAVFGVFQCDCDTSNLVSFLKNKYHFCVVSKPIGKLI